MITIITNAGQHHELLDENGVVVAAEYPMQDLVGKTLDQVNAFCVESRLNYVYEKTPRGYKLGGGKHDG